MKRLTKSKEFNQPYAEVRQWRNRWLLVKRYPGSTLLHSSTFDTEEAATKEAANFLAGFKTA